MDKEHIEKELSEYISALTGFDGDIQNSTDLAEMDIDSISLVKIFVFIERKFGISLLESGVTREQIETFGSMVQYIQQAL